MLDYNILTKKPKITIVKNNEYVNCIDLTSQIYNGDLIQGGRIVKVEEYYVARPDLISLAVYGDDKYADVICKINGISNPFELNEGMYLYTPDIGIIDKAYTATKYEDDILDEFKKLSTNKATQIKDKNSKSSYTPSKAKDKSKSETIDKKKKNLQKYVNERRTPGDQTVTDTNYIIDRSLGIVIY